MKKKKSKVTIALNLEKRGFNIQLRRLSAMLKKITRLLDDYAQGR